MNQEKATLPQRIAAFLITWMLTFSVTTLSAPLAKTATLNYLLILLTFLSVLCLFYAKSSSPGKFIMNIQVMSAIDHKPASFFRMFYRETIGKLLSSIFYVGFIYALFNEKRLTLHDILCKTYVVKK
ncbi:MAG: RDD family protein [Candidatus Margulisbacteria bacterium]|nr:RDD family protein [Candidatus Margulisiibacteriota bacterium]